MKPKGLYKLEGHTPVPCYDLLDWAMWYEDADRVIARDKIQGVGYVSTVFLGLDHYDNASGGLHPLLFETMIFGGVHDEAQWRYRTWEEAEQGHRQAVALAKACRDVPKRPF